MFDVFYISLKPADFPWAIKVKDREEARELSRTRFCWILDGHNDYTKFDLMWEPSRFEANQVHVWPSQWQDHGGTEFIPKDWDGSVNYQSQSVLRDTHPYIVYLEHGNDDQFYNSDVAMYSRARFINDYLGTLKRVVSKHKDEDFIWVTSSVCDYRTFHFSWHPSEWQNDMLHVFASDEQKFGDTFYINVKNFLAQCDNLELLEWYDTICFHDHSIPRHPMPEILHDCDSQVDAIKEQVFGAIKGSSPTAPLVLYTTRAVELEQEPVPTINLWRPKTRTITPLTASGNTCIVPKDALIAIQHEAYDYPHINKDYMDRFLDTPLDIVFMSNGEECAEANYKHLCDVVPPGHIVHHVQGVEGRIASARAAAAISGTDWFFSINAKLKVDKQFNWNWQPDRLQQAKHYIFHAYNPYTKDTYGHMAAIAWNKKLVNTDTEWGLDFTMSHKHEVVPVLSGEAVYGPKEWDLWRTAFREVIKLMQATDAESKTRLQHWVTADDEWTAIGAADARHFCNNIAMGDQEKLKLSFDWEWLGQYFVIKYAEWSKPV